MRAIGDRAVVYHHEYGRVRAVWSKASHVPLYGWAREDQDDPEDWDLLSPQPTVIEQEEARHD